MKIKLTDLLDYKNDRVISRYQRDFPHSRLSPSAAWSELMKYIWLCLQHKSDLKESPKAETLKFTCAMHSEMKEIDNMWHTFLFHTQDYLDFCNHYLNGYYFHHQPTVPKPFKMSTHEYALQLQRYLSYIYAHLGEETLLIWFAE